MVIYGNSCSKKIYGGEEHVEASNAPTVIVKESVRKPSSNVNKRQSFLFISA